MKVQAFTIHFLELFLALGMYAIPNLTVSSPQINTVSPFKIAHNTSYEIESLSEITYDKIKSNLVKSENILLGSWALQSIHYIQKDTTYVQDDIRYGRILFTDKAYAIVYNPRLSARTAFKNLSKPADEEILSAFGSIVFNSGGYSIEEDVIVTTADLAKVPGFEGGKQYYRFSLKDNILEMVMFDETYPDGQKPEWYGSLRVRLLFHKEN